MYRFTRLEERIGSVVERVIVRSRLARILKSKQIIRSLTFRALIVVLSIKLKDQSDILFGPSGVIQASNKCSADLGLLSF